MAAPSVPHLHHHRAVMSGAVEYEHIAALPLEQCTYRQSTLYVNGREISEEEPAEPVRSSWGNMHASRFHQRTYLRYLPVLQIPEHSKPGDEIECVR